MNCPYCGTSNVQEDELEEAFYCFECEEYFDEDDADED